jgi:hypothetical protein
MNQIHKNVDDGDEGSFMLKKYRKHTSVNTKRRPEADDCSPKAASI